MASYYISGVWRNETGIIEHVYLHFVNADGSWQKGVKKSMAQAVGLKNEGNTIRTIIWNYENINWEIKAECVVVNEQNRTFLRSRGNLTVRDNLDNLVSLKAFDL